MSHWITGTLGRYTGSPIPVRIQRLVEEELVGASLRSASGSFSELEIVGLPGRNPAE